MINRKAEMILQDQAVARLGALPAVVVARPAVMMMSQPATREEHRSRRTTAALRAALVATRADAQIRTPSPDMGASAGPRKVSALWRLPGPPQQQSTRSGVATSCAES